MDELKDRLISARTAAGRTQQEVAKAVKMAQPSYFGLEKGDSKSTSKIVEIAVFLNVNPIWLALGTGPREIGALSVDLQYVASTPQEQVFLLDFRDASDEAKKLARAALLGDQNKKSAAAAGKNAKRMSQ